MDFPKFLKERRAELGVTQEKLGEMLEVNYHAISRYECGKSSPTLDILEYIVNSLGFELIVQPKTSDIFEDDLK